MANSNSVSWVGPRHTRRAGKYYGQENKSTFEQEERRREARRLSLLANKMLVRG